MIADVFFNDPDTECLLSGLEPRAPLSRGSVQQEGICLRKKEIMSFFLSQSLSPSTNSTVVTTRCRSAKLTSAILTEPGRAQTESQLTKFPSPSSQTISQRGWVGDVKKIIAMDLAGGSGVPRWGTCFPGEGPTVVCAYLIFSPSLVSSPVFHFRVLQYSSS